MNQETAIANLRAIKRQVKSLPDTVRALRGYAERALQPATLPGELGLVCSFEPRAYRPGESAFPIVAASPGDGNYMTTFFDVAPFSPSGRYLAATCVPFLHRIPLPGDVAQVVVIDLEQWQYRIVYRTTGWGAQLGANVQWGRDDTTLFCNDVFDGRGRGVRIDLNTLTAIPLGGPIYGLTPDRRHSFSGDIQLINALIPGYGIPDPLLGSQRQLDEWSNTEGIWRTDLESGDSRLLISFADLVPRLDEQASLAGGRYHVFNIKVNRQGTHLFAVLFCRSVRGRTGTPIQLVTMDIDGNDPRVAMPDRLWRRGGHHPNWMPDGDHILMNLRRDGKRMEFVQFHRDGSGLETVAPGHKGSGHPSLNPSGTHLLTDCYTRDGFIDARGEVPLRLIELATNMECEVARIFTNRLDGPRRVDPHPVWSEDGRRIAFNGVISGRRQILVADMGSLA